MIGMAFDEYPVEDKFKLIGAAASKYGCSIRELERYIHFGREPDPEERKYAITPPCGGSTLSEPAPARIVPKPRKCVEPGTNLYEFRRDGKLKACGSAEECRRLLGYKNIKGVYALVCEINKGKRARWTVKVEKG